MSGGMVHSVAVNLEPAQYLAGWRAQSGQLFIPTLSEARVGEEVALRVGIYGQTIRATLFGKIGSVRRVGRPALPPGIELAIDRASLPAASFLAMAARGEPVVFREREPRFVVHREVQVTRGAKQLRAATLNVSEGGCALRWPGDAPQVGDVVRLRVGEGLFAPLARAVVCWATSEAHGSNVGLRVIPEGRAARAWRSLVSELVRSGARSS